MNLCHAAVQTYVFFSLLEVVEFAFNLIFIHVKLYFILILKKELLLHSYSKILPSLFFFLFKWSQCVQVKHCFLYF